jgi:hypothetical protein
MMEDMSREGVFQPVLMSQNPQRGKGGDGGAAYEMDVFYVPRAGAPAELEKSKRPVDTASRKGEPQ